MEIILYGGSFDPVHIGHAFVANEVYQQFRPDKFIFMPAGQSPHKTSRPNVSDQHRLNMIEQTIEYLTFGEIDTFEIEQSGKSYTYHTVLYLKEKYKNCTLKILIGYDQYEAIDKWYNLEAITSLASFIVVNRSRDELNLREPFIPFTLPRMDVSATDIRKRMLNGQSVKCLLLDDVEKYIREEHLYEEKKAIKLVEEKLPKKRFEHSLRVAETGVKLAEMFGGDKDVVEIAGILHDYAKYDDLSVLYQAVTHYELDNELLAYNSEILHGPVAAEIMKHEHHIEDEEIYHAIYHHTCGRKQMRLNEKIIFVSDYIEPGRTQPGVDEIRDIVYNEQNLDKAIYEISKRTTLYLVENDKTIYPKTIECLNYYNLQR